MEIIAIKTIYSLPKDIVLLILGYLNDKDKTNFVLTGAYFFKNVSCPILCDIAMKCTKEIEEHWNDDLSKQAFKHGCLSSPEFCSEGCRVIKSKVIKCSVYPWKCHNLAVEYYHNPRDVDILSWYLDNKKIGYTIL